MTGGMVRELARALEMRTALAVERLLMRYFDLPTAAERVRGDVIQ